METFDMWLKSVEVKLQGELDLAISLHPEDSISYSGPVNPNVSLASGRSKSKSVSSSRLSRSTTASSAGLKASAKKAALSVEAAAFKKRQDTQMEELLLKQRKENLKIEVELAKAEAEERVYSRREERIPLTPPGQPPVSTPHETDERTLEDSECLEKLPLTLASHLATSTPCQIKEEGTVEAPECQEQLPSTPAGRLPASTLCPVKEEIAAEVPECKDHLPLIPPSQTSFHPM